MRGETTAVQTTLQAELSLRLIILHAHLKGGLIVMVAPIVTWVPGSDLLAGIEKGKD